MTPDLVLLDRDGTLNTAAVDARYVVDPAQARLLPGAAEAVRLLNAAGVPVVVVTNQRGLATGALTWPVLEAVHETLTAQLAEHGARVEAWYVCPHDEDQCDCRKPLPGLLSRAVSDRPGTEARRCHVIGDTEADVLAGAALQMPGTLLSSRPDAATVAASVAPSLLVAVIRLLAVDC